MDNLQRSLKIPRQNHVCKRLRRRCQPPFPTLIQIGEEEQKSPNRKGRKCGQKTSSMTGESWRGGGGGDICAVCSASGLLLEYRTGGRAMDSGHIQPTSLLPEILALHTHTTQNPERERTRGDTSPMYPPDFIRTSTTVRHL